MQNSSRFLALALVSGGFALSQTACERTPTATSSSNSTPGTAAPAATDAERDQLKSNLNRPTNPHTDAATVPTATRSAAPHGGGAPGSAGELKLTAPTDWKPVQPRSAMRKAQYALPAAEGDSEDGELVIFDSRSLGGGGGVEDNLARWRGMMTAANGDRIPDEAVKRENAKVGNLTFSLLDITGRYAPSQMPGMPATPPRDDFRMLAAVIEAGEERTFIRATGPSATMAKHYAAFRDFVTSAKP